jgi:hypothetical protein
VTRSRISSVATIAVAVFTDAGVSPGEVSDEPCHARRPSPSTSTRITSQGHQRTDALLGETLFGT